MVFQVSVCTLQSYPHILSTMVKTIIPQTTSTSMLHTIAKGTFPLLYKTTYFLARVLLEVTYTGYTPTTLENVESPVVIW